jgi:hypothetical protein
MRNDGSAAILEHRAIHRAAAVAAPQFPVDSGRKEYKVAATS